MSESPRERDRSENGWHRDKSQSRERGDNRDKDSEHYTQIYIAKLSRNTRESEIRDAFSKYGEIKAIVLKYNYAFVDFEQHEAADQAVREMNGRTFVNGEELVVEQSGREKKKSIYERNLNYDDCSARREEKKERTTEGRRLLQLPEIRPLVSTLCQRRPIATSTSKFFWLMYLVNTRVIVGSVSLSAYLTM